MSLLSIKSKIRIVVVTLSIGIATVGFLGIVTSNNLLQISNGVIEERFPNYSYLRDIGIDIHQVLLSQKAMFYYPIDSNDFRNALENYNKNIKQSEDRFNNFLKLEITKVLKKDVDQYQLNRSAWLKSSSAVTSMAQNETEEKRLIGEALLYSDLLEKFYAMEDGLDSLADSYSNQIFQIKETDFKTASLSVIIQLLISVLMVVAGVTISLILFIPMLKRLKAFQLGFENIARGDGDLSQRLDISGNDEITSLCISFNTFIQKLQLIITDLSNMTKECIKIKDSLVSSTTETSASVTEITANLTSIDSLMDTLDKTVQDGADNNSSISDDMAELNNEMSQQTLQLDQMTEFSKVVSESLTTIDKEISKEKVVLDNLLKSSSRGLEQVVQTNGHISEVNNFIGEISNLVTIINGISAKTNLLAMNAAIEAAHAGDAGKGFSVVADEIRKLAETSANNSKKISTTIKEIINTIKKTADSSEGLNQAFSRIEGDINGINSGLNALSDNSNRLLIKTSSLNSIIDSINSNNKQVVKISEKMNLNQEDLKELFKIISNRTLEVKSGTSESSVGISEISKESIKVSNDSEELATLIDSLSAITDKFTL